MSFASRPAGDEPPRRAVDGRAQLMAVPDLFAPVAPDPEAADTPRTHVGRHVADARPGLRWVVAWTFAGTLVPGAGLIAAGHRRAGGVLLAVGIVTPVTVGGALWRRSAAGGLDGLGSDPRALALGAALALGGGALLAGVTLATNRALLRRSRPGRLRRAANMLVTGAMIGAILGGAWLGGTELLDRRAAAIETGAHS
jgi:polyisoprenyl-teichoic acid--peptidoglycan teichoic acid transferase